MKLMYIVGLPELGGSNRSLISLIRDLKNQGHSIHVVMSMKGALSGELDKMNIEYSCIYHRLFLYPDLKTLKDYIIFIPRLIFTLIADLLAFLKLNKLVKQINPDIIHTNVSCINIGFFVSKFNNISHVWHIREYNTLDFNRTPIPSMRVLKHQVNKSNPIFITKGISCFYNSEGDRNVIYNGIKVPAISNPINFSFQYFLHVGGITEKKGVEVTIRNFAEIKNKHKNFKLLMAGGYSDDYKSKLDKIIKDLNIPQDVVFLGVIDNVSDYMASATSLIVSSYNEAFGRITAEAMASRCIVIGRNTAGTKEQFDNGLFLTGREIGFRFTKDCDLCHVMEKVINLSSDAIEMIKDDAERTVRSLYSVDNYTDNIMRYYNKIKYCRNL